MSGGNFVQSNFQGGEWSKWFQGRTDHKGYRTALNVCLNGLPTEEGVWTRRTGFEFIATTYKGQEAKLITFDFDNSQPYTLELTNGSMRMFNGQLLVKTNDAVTIANISPDNTALFNLSSPVSWSTGDQVEMIFDQTTPNAAVLFNRQFNLTVVNSTQVTLTDPVTGSPVTGADVGWAPGADITIARILLLDTPWGVATNLCGQADFRNVRSVQLETTALLCEPWTPPWRLDGTPPGCLVKGLPQTGQPSAVVETVTTTTTQWDNIFFVEGNAQPTDGATYQVFWARATNTFIPAGGSGFVWSYDMLDQGQYVYHASPSGEFVNSPNREEVSSFFGFLSPVNGGPNWLAPGPTMLPGPNLPLGPGPSPISNAVLLAPPGTAPLPPGLVVAADNAAPTWAQQYPISLSTISSPAVQTFLQGVFASAELFLNPPVTTTVINIATAVPWQSGDTVQVQGFLASNPSQTITLAGVFTIGLVNANALTLYPVGSGTAFDPTTIGFTITALIPVTVNTSSVAIPPTAADFATFTFEKAVLQDGPYLDVTPQTLLTPSATGLGSINFTVSFQAYSSTTSYSVGDRVTDVAGNDFVSLVNTNLNHTPLSSPSQWSFIGIGIAFAGVGVQPKDIGRMVRMYDGTNWYWGFITARGGLSTFTANITTVPDAGLNGGTPGTGLSATTPMPNWRVGVYSDVVGWPTGGCYYQGRIWLIGQVLNRIDASISGVYTPNTLNPYSFQPTGQDGTVSDANGLSWTLDAGDVNRLLWAQPAEDGILIGTRSGEWLLQASTLNDPITPTSVQALRKTRYGCADVLPAKVPLALLFVQKFGKKVMELLKDVFTGRYTAPNLSVTARHLGETGIEELAYQEETTPVVWQRTTDGNFSGCTYLRKSSFTTEDPSFAGWHRHSLGSGRKVERLVVGPSQDGNLDVVNVISNDPTTAVRHFEVQTPPWSEDSDILTAWFVDNSRVPVVGDVVTHDGADWMRLYGLWHLNGKTVACFVAGLDCGDLTVQGGYVDVPLDQPGGILTRAALTFATDSDVDFGALTVQAEEKPAFTPVIPAKDTILEYTGTLVNISAPSSNGGLMVVDYNQQPDGNYYGYSLVQSINPWTAQGVIKWNVATGAPVLDQNANQVLAGIPGISFGGGDGISPDVIGIAQDDTYIYTSTPKVLVRISKSTLIADHHVSLSPGNPYDMTATVAGGQTYVTWADISGQTIRVVNMDTSAIVFTGSVAGTFAHVVDATASNNYLRTYEGIGRVVAIDSWDGVTTPASFQVYLITIQADGTVTQSTIGTVHASDVNHLWTAFSSIGTLDVFYDQADGNVCTFVQSINGDYALIKIDVSNGKLKWVLPVKDVGFADRSLRGNSRVTNVPQPLPATSGEQSVQPIAPQTSLNNVFSYLGVVNPGDGSRILYQVNLITGQIIGQHKLFNTILDGSEYQFSTIAAAGFQPGQPDTCILFAIVGYTFASPFDPAPISAPTRQGFTNHWARIEVGLPSPITEVETPVKVVYNFPAVVGFTYNSDGQIVRPALPPETFTQTGPGEAKSRRSHMFGVLLQNSLGSSFGTTFGRLIPVVSTSGWPGQYLDENGNAASATTMLNGVYWSEVDDTYTFDGALCWRVSRPYPMTVASVTQFIEGQDR